MLRLLLIFIVLIGSAAHAKDYRELIAEYVKINNARINTIKEIRNRFKGVEIIVADKSKNLASRFGHGTLRLIDDNETWTDDVVISFSALPDEENYSITKSLTGGYPIIPQIMTMLELWNTYTQNEGRDLKRYVINLDNEQLQKLLTTLFAHLDDPTLLGKYTFLSNNCIGALTRIFIEAGITKYKGKTYVPTSISSWIDKNELSLYPEIVMKNHRSTNEKVRALNINELSNEELLSKFTKSELLYVYFNNSDLSEEKVDFLAGYLRDSNNAMNSAYDFTPVHQDLYTRCSQETCLKTFAKDEMRHLTPHTLIKVIVHRLGSKQKDLKEHLRHLKFKQKTLVEIKRLDHDYVSHEIVVKNNERYVEFELSSVFNEREFKRFKLPAHNDLNELVLVKTKDGVELRQISL